MRQILQSTLAATALTGVSLYLWRVAYISSDWAILALIPLAAVVCIGTWPLMLDPWKARLRLALRDQSPLGKFLTGRIRAGLLSSAFTATTVTLLAWQAFSASVIDASIMLIAFLLSGCIFSTSQDFLVRHFHQPFARAYATSLVTWLVALPFTVILATSTWTWASHPGSILDAGLLEALRIGFDRLPERGGWIAGILAVPSGYEAAKLWGVVQMRDYPIVGLLFSLDSALFSFILCRTAIIITLFVEEHVIRRRE